MTTDIPHQPTDQTDEAFMMQALAEADSAEEKGEVPVGAVIAHAARVIGRGHNLRESLNDPTAHAEMIAITAAAEALGSWRLSGCTLYVTLEPCVMCAGAIVLARIDRLVFGAGDPKAGACGSLYSVPTDERLNHRLEVVGGVLADQAASRLQRFFAKQRALGQE
jgi:tRNA(adenine34) deaminase